MSSMEGCSNSERDSSNLDRCHHFDHVLSIAEVTFSKSAHILSFSEQKLPMGKLLKRVEASRIPKLPNFTPKAHCVIYLIPLRQMDDTPLLYNFINVYRRVPKKLGDFFSISPKLLPCARVPPTLKTDMPCSVSILSGSLSRSSLVREMVRATHLLLTLHSSSG